jgi:accessory gene regulator B
LTSSQKLYCIINMGDDMYSKLSNYITDQIYATVPNVESEKREIIEYGAYMTLSEVSKVTVLLITAAILNVFIYAVGIIFVFGFLRMTLGGIHAKTHWGCIISHSCFVYGIMALSFVLNVDRLIVTALVVPYVLTVSYIYAPADMPVKPVVSKKQKLRLRITGFILLGILFIGAQFINQIWFNIIMLTCALQNTLMTPLVYKLTNNKYGKEETP